MLLGLAPPSDHEEILFYVIILRRQNFEKKVPIFPKKVHIHQKGPSPRKILATALSPAAWAR